MNTATILSSYIDYEIAAKREFDDALYFSIATVLGCVVIWRKARWDSHFAVSLLKRP